MRPFMRPLWAILTIALAASCVGAPKPDNASLAVSLPGGSAYSPTDALPLAPELTKKVLPNGLTYYVRRNGNPGGRAVMYLIINSGSSNETDEQLGYAHFVEHMAFNGTASFPENEIVRYMRSIGMEFGAEVNAHTTREETLYALELPSGEKYFDTGLKILKEWATAITFDPVEVEKEKGVILEELRLGLGPDETARVREVGGLLAGTRHAGREPIGTEESIRGATAEKLAAFFREHYRPDRMAIIVVGDISVSGVAAKIETEFSFPSADGAVRERPLFAVPVTKDMGFVSTFDPNFETSVITYRKIVPYLAETVIGDYAKLLRVRIAAEAIRLRLSDLSRSGEASWRDAYFDDDYFYGRTRIYSFSLTSDDGGELEAFAGLAREVERLRRHGFTESEFKRTVDLYYRWLDTLDVEDNDLRSDSFADEYVRNFMYGEPVPGVVNERVYIKDALDAMTLEDLNAAARTILAADEGFVGVRARTGAGNAAVTEPAFESALESARAADLAPLASSVEDQGLFDDLPEPGAITSETALSSNITELTLSNGARVLLKPTTYNRDSISFLAWSAGGYTVLPADDYMAAALAPSLMPAAGFGSMSATRVDELTASINASLSWAIDENGDIMAGKTATKDLETFLRLVYLTAAEPGRDARAFEAARDKLAAQIGPYVRDPDYRFSTAWSAHLFGGNPRTGGLDAARTKAISFQRTRDMCVAAFADASEFTYMLVGDFDLETAKALVARHIGAIPAGSKDEPSWIEPSAAVAKGDVRVDYRFAKEDRASVRMVWAGQAPWSWERETALGLMAQALNNRLLDALREDLGATYVVSSESAFSSTPVEQYVLVVQFDTDPARVDELVAKVKAEVAALAAGGLPTMYVDQIRAAAQRAFDGRSRTNDFWVNKLGNAVAYGIGFDVLTRERQASKLADPAGFAALAAELLTPERSFVYVMLPE